MPRRGSRAQLIHVLAQVDALNHAIIDGRRLPPGAFYESYSHHSRAYLEALVADAELAPRKPGRPKRGSRYTTLITKVDEVRARRKGISVRAACNHVATKHRASADVLRKLYRAKRPN